MQRERRLHDRVRFFHVPAAGALEPVWVFQSSAFVGIMLNYAETGLQILTLAEDVLNPSHYNLPIQAHPALDFPRFSLPV